MDSENSHDIRRLIPAIQALLSVIILYLFRRSGLIPSEYLLILAGVLAVFIILPGLLMGGGEHRCRFYTGLALSVACSVLLIFAGAGILSLTGIIRDISGSQTETALMAVYQLKGADAQDSGNITGAPVAVLRSGVKDDTEQVIAKIEETTGASIDYIEYTDSAELMDALLAGECRSAIMNTGFVDALKSLDEYKGLESQIQQLETYELTSAVYTQKQLPQDVRDIISSGRFTVYISGIDNTGPVDSEGNSDANILAVINLDTRQILLVSTPRDYYVELSVSHGRKDKLTHAGIYGIQTSMETLEMLYDTDIDYYFRVNFNGFEDLIDALGGIDVESDYDFVAESGCHYDKGMNHLSGSEALAFARERYSFESGDRQRGKNQMEVIKAVIDASLDPSVLTNFQALSDSLIKSVDTDIPYDLISTLVKDQIRDDTPWDVVSYSVNGSDGRAPTYSLKKSLYVMIPDEDTVEYAKELIREVLAGETVVPEENTAGE